MNYKEIEKFRAIPFGGLKMLFVISLFGIATWVGLKLTSTQTSILPLIAVASVIGSMIGSWIRFSQFPREYWRRNVVGFALWIYRDENSDALVEMTLKRGQWLSGIAIPLGGWFHRAGRDGCGLEGSRYAITPLHLWRIRRSACQLALLCDVTDPFGEHVRLTPEKVYTLVEFLAGEKNRYGREYSLGHVIAFLLKKSDDLGEANSKLQEARSQVDALNSLLAEAIRRIDRSQRFIKSGEAMGIRTWLADEFVKLLHADDPRRQEFAQRPKERLKKAAKR